MAACLFINLYKDDIVPDLADALPGDDIFTLSAKEAAESSRTWNNESRDPTGFAVKFYIHRTAQTFAGTDIDDFFLL